MYLTKPEAERIALDVGKDVEDVLNEFGVNKEEFYYEQELSEMNNNIEIQQ